MSERNLRFIAKVMKCGTQLRIGIPKAVVDWLKLKPGQILNIEILEVKCAVKEN